MAALHLCCEEGVDPLPAEQMARLEALAALVRARHRLDGDVQLILTDDEHMRALNARFRGRDCTTDVLSFDLEVPEGLPVAAAGLEIYISMEQARRQAAALQVSPFEEVARLCAHGLLHLAGFEHGDAAALEYMERETEALLQAAALLQT